ncbi:TRAP transporter small permease [Pelagibacterium xiamenense]|uniref:TRAP transporter small permease n=1 Tax=Pelagibacterium xiamenense TaxID=2901140 RepID=UPI001E524AA3|nr:TRAP transporter small permease [Pelagibacterium xiamenense]MCD7059014.1 TRAP transporter small permease [Pelagibacterium xiamenense]
MDRTIVGRAVAGLAKLTAIAGGIVLLLLAVLVVVSVTGRALIWAGLRPVTGDYELVAAGVGFAVFAFLPWAHLNRGHAVVTILSDTFGPRVNAWILVVTDFLMLAAAIFIAWRHGLGMIDKFNYGETTILLRMPLGWGYASGLVGAVVFVIVAFYVLVRSIADALSGRGPSAHEGGAGH